MAVLSAIGMALAPEGRVKKAVKLICGAAVLISLLSGIRSFDYNGYSRSLAEYRSDAEKLIEDSMEEREYLKREYIEERCRAYILDKAAEAGAELESVEVNLDWSTDGYWYPVGAELSGGGDESAKYTLSKTIESELGIPEANLEWIR